MNIEFVGRHVNLDERVRRHAETKIGRFAKLLGQPVEVHVTLESEKYRQIAEVRIRQRRSELLAREAAPDLLEALDLALDKVEGQARRTRDRRVSRKRRPARAAAAQAVAVAGGGKES